MNYFFIPRKEGTLPHARSFQELLTSRWPQAQIEEPRSPVDVHALEFIIPMRHSEVHGSLRRAGDSVVFVGDLTDCAEFALWCQSIISPGEAATFCDESMSGILELDATTTLANILQAFSR